MPAFASSSVHGLYLLNPLPAGIHNVRLLWYDFCNNIYTRWPAAHGNMTTIYITSTSCTKWAAQANIRVVAARYVSRLSAQLALLPQSLK